MADVVRTGVGEHRLGDGVRRGEFPLPCEVNTSTVSKRTWVFKVTAAWLGCITSVGETQCAAVTMTLGATSVPVHRPSPMTSAATVGYSPTVAGTPPTISSWVDSTSSPGSVQPTPVTPATRSARIEAVSVPREQDRDILAA